MRTKFDDIVTSCTIRFDHGDPALWKHSDFVELSREILHDTKVSISTNTLKRIFGKIAVDEHYVPQQATVVALEKYGQGLYSSNQESQIAPEPEPYITPEIKSRHLTRNRWLKPGIFIGIVAIAALLVFLYQSREQPKALLRLDDMEGLLPATAIFDLEVPKSKDSLFLNFGDKTPWEYVQKGAGHLTHVYLYPGVFSATLQSRRDTLKSTTVYVRSDKWIGLGYREGGELPRHYYEFQAAKTGEDSLFHISNKQLITKGIDTSGLVYTRLCNFSPLDYKGEDFVFEATFKNVVDEKGIYCKSTQFQISGIKNRIRFRLASPGCSNRITNFISEKTYNGTKTNLSRFAVDLNRWTTVKMLNHNKKVTLYVNGKELYSGDYQQPIGEIKGVFLEFEGTALVKSCSLSTQDGKSLYQF